MDMKDYEYLEEWYQDYRIAYRTYFTHNTSLSQEGRLINDGIGDWLDNENKYECWGEGLSATAIKLYDKENRLKYGGDSGLNLGKKIAMLSMEYAWLKEKGDGGAQMVLNELFLALQAYRRLDMTANQLLLKYFRFTEHKTCNELLAEQGIRLDGYTGFFIRDDVWYSLRSKKDGLGKSNLSPSHADGALLNVLRKLEQRGGCGEHNGQFISCFKALLDLHLFNSQDQIIGIMHGLAFAKRFLSDTDYVEVKGERYYLLNIVYNIANALWIKTKSCSRSMKIPNCEANCDSWKHGTGSNTKAFQKGITEIYNYIFNDKEFPSFIDHYLFGVSLPISRLRKSKGNSRFNIRMFLKLQAAGNLQCDCKMVDDAYVISYYPAVFENALLYDDWDFVNSTCVNERTNRSLFASLMVESMTALQGELPCFVRDVDKHLSFPCPSYQKDYGWCQGGPLEYNDVACSNATTSIYSPVDYLYMYWILKWVNHLDPQPGNN